MALRLWRIEANALWGDEALTLLIAEWPTKALFFYPVDPTPGLYYFAHKTLIGATSSVAIARSISLVAGALLVPIMFLLARSSRISGLLAATLTALNYPLIDYSQEARAYSLLLLWIGLSGYAFVSWHRNRSRVALSGFAVANLLALYTHFIAIFWVAPMIAASFALSWHQPQARAALRIVTYVTVFLALPQALRLVAYPKASFHWLAQAGLADAIGRTGSVLLPLGLVERGAEYAMHSFTTVICVVIFGLMAFVAWHRRAAIRSWALQNAAAASLIAISLAAPVAIWLFGFIAKPILMPRTLLIAVPGFLLAVSLASGLIHRMAGPVAVLLYATSLAITGTARPKPDWRTVAHQVAQGLRPGDVVLVCPGWQSAAFRHAFTQKSEVPLVALFPEGPVLMESGLGSDSNWTASYLKNAYGRRNFVEGEAALASAKRVWRINEGCDIK